MRYIWFICICLTIAVGGFLCLSLINNPKYKYEPPSYRGDFEHINGQLSGISKHLQSYYTQNKRYPDNNEGLMALKDLRERLLKVQNHLPPPIGSLTPTDIKEIQDIGFDFIRNKFEMAAFDGGILSSWLEPFIYENRRGLPEDLFTDSPVNQDKGQYYSLKVDDGIYVYSVGAMIKYKSYAELLSEIKMMKILSLAIAIISIILIIVFIRLFIKAKRPAKEPPKPWVSILRIISGTILALASIFIALIPWSVTITCYAMSSFGLHSRPRMIKEYNTLLDKYHQRGVINQQTYQKIKTALDDVNKLIEDNKIK